LNYININGHVLPATAQHIEYSHHTLRNGGGLFETMLMQNGAVELWTYHRQRLFAGLKQLGFTLPETLADELETGIYATAAKNNFSSLCRLRLQVFNEEKRGLQYIIECFAIDVSIVQLNTTGLTVGLAQDIQKVNDNTANLKSWNVSLYEVATERAKAHHWDDMLIYNRNGHIIESTRANVFWIKENVLFTPPLSEGCVAGIMRKYLCEQLPVHGYILREHILTNEILKNADSIFLTNAIRRIKWIGFIDDVEYDINIIPEIYNILFPPQ
jgi:branched-chain amino acid aminotransferase